METTHGIPCADDDTKMDTTCLLCDAEIEGAEHQCEWIKCSTCHNKFYTPEDYGNHTCIPCADAVIKGAEHHWIKCSTCHNTFYTRDDYENHTHMPCARCRKIFPSIEDYVQHMCSKPLWKKSRLKRNRPTSDEPAAPYITCRTCKDVFPSLDSYLNHICKPPRKKVRMRGTSTCECGCER